MLSLVPYFFGVLMLLFIYGLLPFIFLKQASPKNPFSIFIIGFAVVGFISILCWIGGPINNFCYWTIIAGAIATLLLNREYHKAAINNLYLFIKQQRWFEKIAICTVLIPILYQSAQPGKINDMGMYYMQTMQWMHGFGLVKGLANIHPAMGLGSAWHSLTVLFDPFSIGFDHRWQINAVLVFVFILFYWFEAHQSKSLFLLVSFVLCMPISFLYLTAPSPDLPLLLLTTVLFYWVWFDFEKLHWFILLLLAVFLFACKPPAFIPVLMALLVFIRRLKSTKKRILFICMSLCLCSTVLYRNYILSGYLLYPYNKPDISNAPWKVPQDWNQAYRTGIISWGLTDRFDKATLVRAGKTGENRLPVWLGRVGYKGLFNKAIFLNFLITIGIILISTFKTNAKLGKQNYLLLIGFLLIQTAEWLLLSQYRLMLPSFVILSGLNLYFAKDLFFSTNSIVIKPVSILAYLNLLFCILAFAPFRFLTKTSRNQSITQSNGFQANFLIQPFSGSIGNKIDSVALGQYYVHFYSNQVYCWDCPVPCQSKSHRNYLHNNFGYVLVPLGPEISDGFKLTLSK